MTRDAKIVFGMVAAVPAAIIGASILCVWAIANGASMRWRLLFRVICHGIPERCLDLLGVPMPICARCFGIYVGVLIGLVVFALGRSAVGAWKKRCLGRSFTADRRPRTVDRLEPIFRAVVFVAAVPLALDGLTQLIGLRESTNPLRIATGLIAGLAFGFWILGAVDGRGERTVMTS